MSTGGLIRFSLSPLSSLNVEYLCLLSDGSDNHIEKQSEGENDQPNRVDHEPAVYDHIPYYLDRCEKRYD